MAAVALAAGLHLGWIDRTPAGFRAFGWLKAGVGLAGVVMATYLIGSLSISPTGAIPNIIVSYENMRSKGCRPLCF
jgi:thiol:disulfide interchange protein DsbD